MTASPQILGAIEIILVVFAIIVFILIILLVLLITILLLCLYFNKWSKYITGNYPRNAELDELKGPESQVAENPLPESGVETMKVSYISPQVEQNLNV
ncbi:hypothetical protein LOD99_15262 [Oopsacas minuta]|uniref:Uncharacterized protein n=1 Tax=Oopsacas minuta TaxID=111878 RepID=A0AAV7KAG0_9METZ|nr:hypothetical protein LOD99_15262 [Oopsacas minuta]